MAKTKNEYTPDDLPSIEMLETEFSRQTYRQRYKKVFRSTVYTLITVAAVAVLVATLWMPVFQVTGSSMTPTLSDAEIVICLKSKKFETGDIIAFYFNNKVLVKRVIAQAGDWVDMDDNGKVFVNGTAVDEPYVDALAVGNCDIELPYQVPENRYFVLGDHRSVSIDSRSSSVGTIVVDDIVGKIEFRVWPLNEISSIN